MRGQTGRSPFYDQLYNLASKTDRKNQTIQYVYDSLYRLSTKTYPDQTDATYIYDLVGKINGAGHPCTTTKTAASPFAVLFSPGTSFTFCP